MAYIEREGDRVWFLSEFREKDLVKQVPGTRWDRDRGQWHGRLSWATCVQARGVFRDDLTIGPELTTWAWEQVTDRVQPCLALREAEDGAMTYVPPAGLELMPRQRAAVEFLSTARSAACCDGMGSGKTVMTIATLENQPDMYPALITCPNSMCRTWEREFHTWAPDRTVAVVKGGAAKRRKILDEPADVYVINWEGLRSHTRLAPYGYIRLSDDEKTPKELNALPLKTVVADEAHRGKNPQAKQTRALWAMMWQAENRFALTGTPVANSPEDMWAIMHAIEPDEWPSKTTFIDRYALQSWSNFGFMTIVGIKGDMRDELFKILDPRFIRRPTQIVVPGLAAKLPPQVREVELVPKQRKAYNQLREELLAELDNGILMASNPLTRMTRLLQLAAAYGSLDEESNFVLSEPSAKLDALDEILDEIGPEEQTVIFAESRQLIELADVRMTKKGIPHALITGKISEQQRDVNVQAFQNGDVRHILATLGAGGEGITLTAARHVIFLQRSFSLVKNKQAEDRVWRKGQTREVQPIDIIAVDTIESRVHETMIEKGDRLEEIARDKETIARWLAK